MALLATASPAGAQSTHLTELERRAPAAAVEPAADIATGGWASAWLAPASAAGARGVLVGVEHNAFANVTSALVATRFRLGIVWQLAAAQTSVRDLFDQQLLEQYPGLGALGASATQVTADATFGGAALRMSLGARYERDELLGDATGAWLARASVAGRLVLGFRAAIAGDRVIDAGGVNAGPGRVTVGLARELRARRLSLTWGAGLVLDEVWARGRGRRLAASAARVSLADLVSLAAAVGVERDPFGGEGWLGFFAFGLGVNVGSWSADFRRGGAGTSQAAPTAVSLLWAPAR